MIQVTSIMLAHLLQRMLITIVVHTFRLRMIRAMDAALEVATVHWIPKWNRMYLQITRV